ncbi:MAG: DUF3404 domain-containing protein [Actinomycetota bacterium]|nr:DUF3404 domain-containing protein [Actinomycetota bacterium]
MTWFRRIAPVHPFGELYDVYARLYPQTHDQMERLTTLASP